MSSDGTWCVYRQEWISWMYSPNSGDAGHAELSRRLSDRALEDDPSYKLVLDEGINHWCLQILLPVLKGEWVTEDVALGHSNTPDGIVKSGSPEEAVLVAKGKALRDQLR